MLFFWWLVVITASLVMGCRYVSELLYIHTKLMIVDDKKVIVSESLRLFHIIYSRALQLGSANLNDRSQKVSYLRFLLGAILS